MRETLQHQMTLAVDLKRKNVIRGESFVLPGSQSQETLQNPWVEDKAQHERVAALWPGFIQASGGYQDFVTSLFGYWQRRQKPITGQNVTWSWRNRETGSPQCRRLRIQWIESAVISDLGRAVWPSGLAGLERKFVGFKVLLLTERSSAESIMTPLGLGFNDIFWFDFSC